MESAASGSPSGEPITTRARRNIAWILIILLAAAVFRLVNLADIPPGMTHDEADHGLTAWDIVNGARDLYFTVGYGREPLYDYATALVMAVTGPTILAARLTSVYFSLIMIAAVYAWARRAFGGPVALLAAAGLAVGFWPVMAGRQALRSIALPAVFALAVLFFWHGLSLLKQQRSGGAEEQGSNGSFPLPRSSPPVLFFALSGLLLGLTTYTYIPARVMWLAFPALVIYLALAAPPTERGIRRLLNGLILTLIFAALVAAPLFFHLSNHPGLEARIDELSAPLRAAAGGDLALLWANARGALRLFTVEGDQTWRYNIPGKPLLGPVMGVLFYAGLLVAGWLSLGGLRNPRNHVLQKKLGFTHASSPGAFQSLVWLSLGFAPVLITGPGLSMTQAIGALPVLFVFPALAMVAGYNALTRWTADRRRTSAERIANDELRITYAETWARRSGRRRWSTVGGLLAVALFASLAALTARDYFGRWAGEPEVRVQYESTMMAALGYLNEQGTGAAAVSTIAPSRYHTPAVALLTLRNRDVQPRWFDGRQSLLFPAEAGGLMLVPGFTPIPDELQSYLTNATLIDELPMRPDDLDRPVRILALDSPGTANVAAMTPVNVRFGESIELLAYDLSAVAVRPGDALTLVTAWRLEGPLPEASLFAHVVGLDGRPVAQADNLGAPGESWVAGDILLQLHTIKLPDDTPPGEYPLVVGVYTGSDGRRLATGSEKDMVTLTTVIVGDEAKRDE